MPDPTPATSLAGIRALLIDIDGVLVLRGHPIAGAAQALAALDAARIPFRLATNTSAMSRRSIAAHLTSVGISCEPDRIISAASAAADHVAMHHPAGRIFLLTTRDGRTEFEGRGLHLLTDDEADRLLAAEAHRLPAAEAHGLPAAETERHMRRDDGARPADSRVPGADSAADDRADAVVIGDASDAMTFRDLDRAFGLIRQGTDFIAMHRNRWWLTARGTTLDAGALVAGLEYSSERRATLTGKPSPTFFAAAIRALASDVGHRGSSISGRPRLRRSEVGMVGDDLWNDVLGAQRAGLRGIFVRSGKHGDAELADAARRTRGGGRPDVVADDIAGVVAALVATVGPVLEPR
jgi:HAD superfamily hydrolase (TIGR01450 family)